MSPYASISLTLVLLVSVSVSSSFNHDEVVIEIGEQCKYRNGIHFLLGLNMPSRKCVYFIEEEMKIYVDKIDPSSDKITCCPFKVIETLNFGEPTLMNYNDTSESTTTQTETPKSTVAEIETPGSTVAEIETPESTVAETKTPESTVAKTETPESITTPTETPVTKTPNKYKSPPNNVQSVAQQVCAENAQDVASLPDSCTGKESELLLDNNLKNRSMNVVAVGYINWNKFKYGIQFDWVCTGALISYNVVLAAAHCGYLRTERDPNGEKHGVWTNNMVIGVLDNAYGYESIIDVKEVIRHPEFEITSPLFDVAIYRLKRNVTKGNRFSRLSCLPTNLLSLHTNLDVAGWPLNGKLQIGEYPFANNYIRTSVDLVPQNICNMKDHYHILFDIPLICTKPIIKYQMDAILLVPNTDHHCMNNVVGITITPYKGKRNDFFTSIIYNIFWIEKNAWPEYFHNV